eukprot:SM000111S18807  [mRNA]  locus=s111:231351:236781:- [translate_table: standard]
MAAGRGLARGPLRARALAPWLPLPQQQPRGPPPSLPPAGLPQAPPPRRLPPPELVSRQRLSTSSGDLPARESMDFDVVIVGAGPSGLAAAIRLKQLSSDLNVCVVEKGAEVGAHILSGNVLETRALDELLPDWKERQAPVSTPVSSDCFYLLTEKHHLRLPSPFKYDGNYVVREVAGFSLSQLVRWLAARAEELGVEIFPGFAAGEVLYQDSKVVGIATNNVGVRKDGSLGPNFQQGMELRGQVTLFGEGCRGSLSETLIAKYDLRAKSKAEHQTYALGIKELKSQSTTQERSCTQWVCSSMMHGLAIPLGLEVSSKPDKLYSCANKPLITWKVALGLITALDYKNPYMSPFQEFQARQVVQYGARSLNEGGYQSVPELAFPGGALLGDAAGFLNVLKIKGTHTAMKSGMLAAEFAHKAIEKGDPSAILAYTEAVKQSWIWEELRKARNFRPPKSRSKMIEYPPPDGKVTFDILTSVYRSGTNHAEDQPSHLKVKDAITDNLLVFDGPEARYCPAKVYEYESDDRGSAKLHINAQNCLHCKACDIKDPGQNIKWTVPEGGGGPAYTIM